MVDRNILRMAHYEIVHKGVPPKVAINEAVELAREFGGERSPAFVNAILDRMFRDRLPPRTEGSEPASAAEMP
jgi:N utilization substance protein B